MAARRKSDNPGWIAGASDKDDPPALKEALTNLAYGRRGPPTEADVPPPSTFPLTPAARAALELRRNNGKPRER